MKWIDKKYEVVRSLGGGGFSDVFLVKSSTGSTAGVRSSVVALKLLKTEITMRPSEKNLICFKNEFNILKTLSHPNIARILDFGLDEELMQYYFTAEYVDGEDIYTGTTGKPIAAINDLFAQALRALEYLHSYRIFHFDIKAANLLVTKKGELKLIDFGLASLDPKGKLMGTASYMAPEIVRGERPDGRADIYSLGVLWYFCLARKNPFRTANPKETVERQKTLTPPPPSQCNPNIPEYLNQIIKRMLEKRPENRYERASQILTDLNILGGLKIETETFETLLSYIPEKGRYIGRKKEIKQIQEIIESVRDKKVSHSMVVVSGKIGTGKRRFLEEVKYFAQVNEIPVVVADAHKMIEIEEWLKDIEDHLTSDEAPKAFFINNVDISETPPPIIERIKNVMAKVPVQAERVPTLIAVGIDEQNAAAEALRALANINIRLENFDREELIEYIISLTGLKEVPDFLVEEILKRTEGNPLFVTELAKSMVAGGALFDSSGRWKESSFLDLGVDFDKIFPASLKDLLMGSYRDMETEEKMVLELLAVARRPANSYELSVWSDISDIGNAIEKLIRKDLLVREPAYSYYFRNELLAGYISEDLKPETREKYHDKIAAYLVQSGSSEDEIARHIGQGSDYRHAFETTSKAGEKYLKKGVGKTAVEYLTLSALHKDALSPEEIVDLNMKLGEAYLISQDYKNALYYFNLAADSLKKIKEEAANINWQIDNLVKIGGTYIKLRELDKAKQSFAAGKSLFKNADGNPVKRLIMENWEGYLALQEGRLDDAENIYSETRILWEKLPADTKPLVTNNELGTVLLEKGNYERAIDTLCKDLAYFKEIKDELLIARSYYNLAQTYQMTGDLEKAAGHFKESAKLAREIKDMELLLCAYNGLGNIYNIDSHLQESREYYERARSLSQQLGDFKSHAAISINIGIIENKMGHTDIAYYEISPALLYLRNAPQKSLFDWQILCRGQIEMADVLIRKGSPNAADEIVDSAKITAKHIPEDDPITFWLLSMEARLHLIKGERENLYRAVKQLEEMATTDEEKATIKALKCKDSKSEDDMEKSYKAILEINKLINSESELTPVLKLILKNAIELSGAESAAIVLRKPDGELNIAAHLNTSDATWNADISHAFAKEAIISGKIIESENAINDPRFSSEASVKILNLKSVLCLPIHVKNTSIGALYLDCRSRIGAFTDAHKDILTTFTDQIGIAIDKTKRIEELSIKSKNMESQLDEMGSQLKHYEEMMDESVHGFVTEHKYEGIVGRSKAMSDILQTIDKIMNTDISVLLTGESGTGKELIARALHFNNSHRKGRFVTINCGAIPATLMESELFGYKAGAFTGATQDKKGLFEDANNGTIFLDEVTDIDHSLQVKLLRVIQEKELTRVGDTRPKSCDVRIIAATNKDIERELKEGRFREDLYWRICQIRLHIPPLRDRREDIPALTKHFLSKEGGTNVRKISPHLLKIFMEYNWPGNIRELESLISVACALSEGEFLDENCVPKSYGISTFINDAVPEKAEGATSIKIDDDNLYRANLLWKDYENIIFAKAYEASNFKARRAAKLLGVAPTTMYSKVKALRLDNKDNPLFKSPFKYSEGKTLKSYTRPIFNAALTAANNRSKQAISSLGISQGFFYKVMKK